MLFSLQFGTKLLLSVFTENPVYLRLRWRHIMMKRWAIVGISITFLFSTHILAEPAPVLRWVARYNSEQNLEDYAMALAVDNSGNLFVTGWSFTGVGAIPYDYATIKYGPNGNQLWLACYSETRSGGHARGLGIDDSGNVHVTGVSYVWNNGAGDYATIKYDTNGQQLWATRYNGPGNAYDEAYAMAVDNSGHVSVTGWSVGSSTGNDYATIKYDPNGAQLWVARYNGPGNAVDAAYAMAVDNSGNVFVTGWSLGSGTGYDYATIKYGNSGNQLWAARYNGPGNAVDAAYAMAADNSGNVYVTGSSEGSGTDSDYATIKYDPNGAQLWLARYNGPGNSIDIPRAIAVDSSGNTYVTGISTGSGTGYDYATIKYGPAGNQLWVARYTSAGNWLDYADALVVDSSDNVYVTGTVNPMGYCTTFKYDPNGNQLWMATYTGSFDTIQSRGMAIDNLGNIYVTGSTMDNGTDHDWVTIKYSQNSVILTIQTEPGQVTTITPVLGMHEYAQGIVANISAQRFVDCPSVYVFDHWEGDVAHASAANTTIVMDTDKTVEAVFVDGRSCGDECYPYPDGDLNHDCRVNFLDIAVIANTWLVCTDPNCD
jgi:hypothetical protein